MDLKRSGYEEHTPVPLGQTLFSTVNQGFDFSKENVIGNLHISVVNIGYAHAFLGRFIAAITQIKRKNLSAGRFAYQVGWPGVRGHFAGQGRNAAR